MRSLLPSKRAWCCVPTLLMACGPIRPRGFAGTGGGDSEEPLPEEGCQLDPDRFREITLRPTEVATVIEVSWQLEEPGSVRALFQEADGSPVWTRSEPIGVEGSALLLGLPARTEARLRLVTELDGALHCSGVHTATTGNLPDDLPLLEIEGTPSNGVERGYVVTNLSAPSAGPMAVIVDPRGRVVWAQDNSAGGTRTRLARDRRSVLTVEHHKDGGSNEGVQRRSLDGRERILHHVPAAWVDFLELPDGTLAVLVDDVRELTLGGELRTIRGDAVVLHHSDGENEWLWSSFDAAWPDPDRHYEMALTSYGQKVEDWSHVNGMGLDPSEGLLYLTAGNLDSVFAVDLTTGATLWELSSSSEDWYIDSSEPLLSAPHSVQPLGAERLLVFNRSSDEALCSEVVEIELDYRTGTARRGWAAQSWDCLHVNFLGNAERLSGGDTLVSWSSMGRIDRLGSDGQASWELIAPMGTLFGFAQHEASLYHDQP